MTQSILIRGAKQLLTLRGSPNFRTGPHLRDLGVVEDGSVLIQNGMITHVGPTRRIENLAAARSALLLDAHGKVVMPAFIDLQTHFGDQGKAAFAGASPNPTPQTRRNGGPRNAMMREIGPNTARALEHKITRILELFAGHGTNMLNATIGFGPDESADTKLLRCYLRLNHHPLGICNSVAVGDSVWPEFANSSAHSEWVARTYLPRLAALDPRLTVGVRCSPEGWDHEDVKKILLAARSYGLCVRLEAASSPGSLSVREGLTAGVRMFSGLENASPEDAKLLADCGATSILLPGRTLMGRMQTYAHSRSLIENGVAPVLATGFDPNLNPLVSMQMVIALGCKHLQMTVEEAITAATFNAAHAIGAGAIAGSLEHGKQANLVVLNVADYREMAYYYGTNVLFANIRRGEVIWKSPSRMAAAL